MEPLSIQSEDQIKETIELQKKSIIRLRKSDASERINKLKMLQEYVLTHQNEICEAMFADFKKPASEVILAELMGIKREIDHTVSKLKAWIRPQSVSTPLILLGTNAHIQYESKGLCLIISPWNYPLNLAICPLIHAIAAGNAIILKPSELSPNTSSFIKKMISTLYDKSEVAVFEGDAGVSTFLLEQKFDHIFFIELSYIKNNFNITVFANELNVNKDDLVIYINNRFGLTFDDFVNKQRVAYFVELIKNPNFKNYTIDALSKESGFVSRNAFYKPFKKFHGGNPSDLIDLFS